METVLRRSIAARLGAQIDTIDCKVRVFMSQLPSIAALLCASAILTVASGGSKANPSLQDVPVALFEKYKLIGIFAKDCSKPASNENPYYVNRALPDGRVQSDSMLSQQMRSSVAVVDTASERKPGEISFSVTVDGKSNGFVVKVEEGRMTVLEYTVDGGVAAGNGQWLNRCES